MVDRDRLARILGLLGSDQDGEVLAAARGAEKLRQQAGLTWEELLSGWGQQSQTRPKPTHELDEHEFEDHVSVARACLLCSRKLNDWDIDFLDGIQNYNTLSIKQKAKLVVICRKCGINWP